MKRFCLYAQLKPEKVEEYAQLHRNAWPEIVKIIESCHLHHYSISLRGTEVFTYYEYTGEDYEADMAKMAADPTTQKWWDIVKPLMEPLADRAEGEFWSDMGEIYHLD